MKKAIIILLAAMLCVFAFACKKPEEVKTFDAEAAFERILSEVKFADELDDASSFAEFAFTDLPEIAEVKFHTAKNAVSDCAVMFKLKSESDMDLARAAIDKYIGELTLEAERYSPEEINKLKNAVIKQDGLYLIACVTNDVSTAKDILKVK